MAIWAYLQKCIRTINDSSKFIVESSPKKLRANPKKIPRAHERPQYIVLTPNEIKTRYIRPKSSGNGTPLKLGHDRRGHYRTYQSERYKAAKGKRQWIDATWVGPTEATVGKRTYRVLLDK